MKDFDRKMRDRHWQKEYARLERKAEKQLRKAKEAFYERTDKDEQEDTMFQRLLELAKGR